MKDDAGGTVPRAKRYFCTDGEVFHADDKTWVLSNQWGSKTVVAVDSVAKMFPDLHIEIKPTA